MTYRLARIVSPLLLLGVAVGGCTSAAIEEEGECPVGAEGCDCTVGGSCDLGLHCELGTCVMSADDGETGGAAGSTEVADDEPKVADDEPVESCAAYGATRLRLGACHKACTYDDRVPGDDLFEDCLSVKMVCSAATPAYCQAPIDCDDDSDCRVGWRCKKARKWAQGVCEYACETTADCPEHFECISSCPNGYYETLGFCEAGPLYASETRTDPCVP